MYNKTYFITGGGTGGHIYPAVAVADELIKNKDYTDFVKLIGILKERNLSDEDYQPIIIL